MQLFLLQWVNWIIENGPEENQMMTKETTLSVLLLEKAREDGLSIREISRQSGVAHTTIARAIEGQQVRVETLMRLAKWLKADPSSLLPVQSDPSDLAQAISGIVSEVPELGALLQTALDKMRRGEIRPETLREIIRYTAWRLSDDNQ